MLGPFEETLVLDWGLGKIIAIDDAESAGDHGRKTLLPSQGSEEFDTCGVIGTPGFMSPEQHTGRRGKVGPATDIYALGAALYVLLTGRPPFDGRSPGEIAAKVERGEFTPPRQVKPEIPRPLEAICLRAMARRPEDRYPSTRELCNDIESWLAGEPVSAWQDPLTARIWRWIGRHRTAVSVTAVSAAAAIVVAAAIGYMLHRAGVVEALRRAEDRLRAERIREDTRRHTQQIRDVTYVNAEKTAQEQIHQKRPGWVASALAEISRGLEIPTPMRSLASLRALAVAAKGGFDLSERRKLTSLNSACLAFSPDGRRLAVGEHHREIKPFCRVQVFDVAAANQVAEYTILTGSLDMIRTGVSTLAFGPDGRWLAAGLRSGMILIWDTQIVKPEPVTLAAHKDPIRGLAFTPDGTTLVSGSADGMVTLWHARPAWTKHFQFEMRDGLDDLALSPDGERLALASNHSGRILDFSSLEASPSEPRTVLLVGGYHEQFAFSPDGRTVVASDSNKNIQIGLSRGQTNRVLVDRDFGVAHNRDVNGLEFHPNGSLLVSGSADNTLKIWDLAADQLLFKMTVLTESAVVPAFRPDGRTLAVATSEGTTLYDVLGLDALTTEAIQNEPVRDFAFPAGAEAGPSVPVLATTTMKYVNGGAKPTGIISSWRRGAISPQSSVRYECVPEDLAPILAFDAHPTLPLLVHNGRLRVRLHEADRCAVVTEIPEKQSSALRFSPDGRRLWGVIDEERIVSWSVPGLVPQTRWDLDRTSTRKGRVGLTCLVAGWKWVVAGSRGAMGYLLRSSDGQKVSHLVASAAIQSIALGADESLAVCGLIDGRLALFRLPSGEAVAEISGHLDAVNAVASSPDGTLVASASRDGTVGLWKVEGCSLTELFHIPSTSGHPVLAVKFDSGGRMLGMLAQDERALRLCNLQELRGWLKKVGLDWE